MTKSFDVDSELIRKLAQLLEQTGLSEIEFESEGSRIRVAKGAPGLVTATQTVPVPQSPPPARGPVERPQQETNAGLTITSPMVGTAYLSPEPGAPPYVEVGDAVAEDQIIMLIEAMKTFNPIRAPKSGTILQVLIDDLTPVEFGEELIVMD